MTVSLIPKDQIRNVWPRIEPMLQKALDKLPGRYETIDIYIDLVRGIQTLWISFDEEDIHSFWTLRIIDYPQARGCLIEWVGGRDMDLWDEGAIDIVKRYAKDKGCSFLESYGRFGMREYAKKHGFKERAIRFEFELKED